MKILLAAVPVFLATGMALGAVHAQVVQAQVIQAQVIQAQVITGESIYEDNFAHVPPKPPEDPREPRHPDSRAAEPPPQ